MKIIILILNQSYFNKDKSKFMLPFIRTTQFQSTILFRGPRLYNNIMFGNI